MNSENTTPRRRKSPVVKPSPEAKPSVCKPSSSVKSQESLSTGYELSHHKKLLVNFKLEVFKDENGKLYTNRFTQDGHANLGRYRLQEIADELKDLFVAVYPWASRWDLVVLSDDRGPLGLDVWLRCRKTPPPPALRGPEPTLLIGDDFVDTTAHEVHNRRLQDNPKLLDGRGSDQVIDI